MRIPGLVFWLVGVTLSLANYHGLAQVAPPALQPLRQQVVSPRHQFRMNQYDVRFHRLDLRLERTSTFVAGHVFTQAVSTVASLDTFAVELHPDLAIDSVLVNGGRQAVVRQGGEVNVVMASAVAAGEVFSTSIYYHGTPPATNAAAIGNGLSSQEAPTWGNRATWSLSQPFAAYEWWPCKQVLTDKIDSLEVHVTTDATNKVGSNGLLQRTVPQPGGKVRYEWKSRYPIAYYLVSVAVSDYVEYSFEAQPAGAPNPILIQNYVYGNPQTLPFFKAEIDQTKPLLEFFSELFTLYPFHREKYGHSMAPFGGGMEHQTMTTQGTFTFTLTAHELAHQWFGDHVTCASWQDIWLNEGFASYAEYLALQQLHPEQSQDWLQDAHTRALASPNGSVHVPDTTNVARIFNYNLTYKKAALLVHMLRFEAQDDSLFFRALRQYQRQFGGHVATTGDLQRVFEEVLDRDLDYFFQQWFYGEGYPVFDVKWNQQGNQLVLRSSQTSSNATTPFFRTDLEIRINTTEGQQVIRLQHAEPVVEIAVEVAGTVTGVEVDPNQWILHRTMSVGPDAGLVLGVKSNLRQKGQVRLYPNPTADFLVVPGEGATPAVAEVYDASGKLLLRQSLPRRQTRVDVRPIPAGRYLLVVRSGRRAEVGSFIKR